MMSMCPGIIGEMSTVICHCKTVSADDVPATLKLNAGTTCS